ncbi:hypothetical protein EV356DRAFT_309754 [Viridothelium virens]|uniref:ACB domain-containing protein n=1 Tax=Viridothelium virens TaxID=1048519 RepID=A0A6A6HJZ8_VIRVR|nr:hypothetical protein EV356DRAFT_309754 [Viridothelium virens]
MADSVDRVFSHALNTVNKIRVGSEKPPPGDRLKLYGLYKQSMEGDVDGVWDRPNGNGEDGQKWDAWKAQSGISRTEAKRRYISTLIETMHKYAAQAPDARELVSELEFVWDQIKSNVPSSSSSSPLQTLGASIPGLQNPPSYPNLSSSQASLSKPPPAPSPTPARSGKPSLRVMSPVSQEEEEDVDDNADREEFVDAPDSQYTGLDRTFSPERQRSSGAGEEHSDAGPQTRGPPRASSSRDPTANQKWRRRVESALVKMTAEVAALREQLEARSLYRAQRRQGFWSWCGWLVWGVFKHITLDIMILGVVLLWMRRKKDRRLEGAVRVLLGDAVAQVQKGVGEVTMAKLPSMPNLKMPRLNGRRGSG